MVTTKTEEPVLYSPDVILILDFLFLTISNLIVAVISGKSFLKYGLLNLLLLSGALLISGLVSVISGLMGPISTNLGITLFDIGLFASSSLQLMSAIVTLTTTSASEISQRKVALASSYFATIIFVLFLTMITYLNYTPTFFMNEGTTIISKAFSTMTIFFLMLSSALFLWQYIQTKSERLYWYSLALILFGIGELSTVFQMQNGDLYNWVGRIAQYIGGLFFLMALTRLSAGEKRSEIYERWATAFSTDQKQLSALFANMLNAFAYCKIITDKQGKPVDWVYLEINSAYEKTLALKRENIIGKKASEIFPDITKDTANWIGKYGYVALNCQPIMFENFREAQKKWYSVSSYCPKKGYFVAFLEDITERKELQQKLEEYAKQLEKLVEDRTRELKDKERLAAIGETAGMVGHDIRNPLQAITNELYVARQTMAYYPEKGKNDALESIGIIQEQTDYISKIVSDLQDYARPLKPEISQIKLSDLVTSIFQTITIPEKVNIVIDIQGFPEIKTDPTFIRRILTNLTNNAIQSMPNGGKLNITASKKGNQAVITVSDTGKGIPEEIKPKIFTPLVTTKAKGQGLGLAVVKRLVEALNGTVTFESEEGKGTKFTILLPA